MPLSKPLADPANPVISAPISAPISAAMLVAVLVTIMVAVLLVCLPEPVIADESRTREHAVSSSRASASTTAGIASLPLLAIGDFKYAGAFLLPKVKRDTYYASGAITLDDDGSHLFFAGRVRVGAILEFSIPPLTSTVSRNDLVQAPAPAQAPALLFPRVKDRNSQKLNRVTGIHYTDNKLIVNAQRYYDAGGKTTDTSFIFANSDELATGTVSDPVKVDGAAHAAGWISEIPAAYQSELGGDLMFGNASNLPIAMRNSFGPSAYAVRSTDLFSGRPGKVASTALLDYPLRKALHSDKYNNQNDNTQVRPTRVGNNDLWTVLSWAVYGFIVPGTRTYAVLGSSGGHASGAGYKIVQDNGYQCGGPCSANHTDYANFYWLYDINDLIKVRTGTLLSHQPRPYDYGVFAAPFQNEKSVTAREFQPFRPIRGGVFDAGLGRLYLTLGGSKYMEQIIVAYDIKVPGPA